MIIDLFLYNRRENQGFSLVFRAIYAQSSSVEYLPQCWKQFPSYQHLSKIGWCKITILQSIIRLVQYLVSKLKILVIYPYQSLFSLVSTEQFTLVGLGNKVLDDRVGGINFLITSLSSHYMSKKILFYFLEKSMKLPPRQVPWHWYQVEHQT